MDTLITSISLTVTVWFIYMIIRNNWVAKNSIKYIDALHKYLVMEIGNISRAEICEFYDNLTPYDDVLFDCFNWSQEQFVTDPELFEKLQKYL